MEGQDKKSDYMDSAKEMFQNFAKSMKAPQIDREALINNHKKNMEAMNDASKMAVEVLKSIAQLQTQYTRQTFEDMSKIVQEMSSSSQNQQWTPPNQTDRLRDMMVRAFDHSNNLSNIMSQSNQKLYGAFQDHVNESMETIRKSADKKKH
jgi:phasin family protein